METLEITIRIGEEESEDEKAGRWLNGTAKLLAQIVAEITNMRRKSLQSRLVNAVVLKAGAASTGSGLLGLASLVGTAKTGAAISTLSGAAANSSALAWVGFGSMAVGQFLVLPAAMVAGAFALLKVWKGKGRPPESLTQAERELVSACAEMVVRLEEEARSGRPVCTDDLRLVVSAFLRPVAQRLSEYMAGADFRALRIRNRIALRRCAPRLDRRISAVEDWGNA